MKLLLVAGARPNFMKIAPLVRALDKHNSASDKSSRLNYILVHTGQHYDYEMSQVFFDDFRLPRPEIHLGIGSGTHAEQTAKIMIEVERVLLSEKPDMVVVVGDVNSTLAAGLAAAKLMIPVAHIEAGIRSYDRSMPEEINRLVTDHLSRYLFTTSALDDRNLKKEGIPADYIFRVGNIMADSLYYYVKSADKATILSNLDLTPHEYAVLTLHRPTNVDDAKSLGRILRAVARISGRIPVVFPIHPRTRKMMDRLNLSTILKNKPVKCIEPLGYRDFLNLQKNARFVITDSGGIQVETMLLNVPCLTLLNVPVWHITHRHGGNILAGTDGRALVNEASKLIDGENRKFKRPPLWDGKTADRIVTIISRHGMEAPVHDKVSAR